MDDINVLKNEIYNGISLLNQWSATLSNLLPVDHRSKVKWYGGIAGAIIEAREESKLVKLINTPIVGEHSFWQLAGLIPEKINSIGEATRKMQAILLSNKSDSESLKIGDDSLNAAFSVIQSWNQYSPSMSHNVFEFGKGRKNRKSLIQYVLETSAPGLGNIVASEETLNKIAQLSLLLLF